MLIIRDRQIDALVAARRREFLQRLVRMLRRHWPGECAALGAAGVRRRVEGALALAARYGIDGEAHLARLLNVTMALGEDFDRDPRYPWAAVVLEEEAFAPRHKVQRLCELTADVLAGRGVP